MEQVRGSLKPSQAAVGTGLLDDEDVTLVSCRFTSDFDYQGHQEKSFGLLVKMEDSEGAVTEQFYSGGDSKRFIAIEDGLSYQPVGTSTNLKNDCKAMLFIGSLVNAGFPESALDSSIDVFDGLNVHVKREVEKDRPGLQKKEESKYPKTILLVSKINTELDDAGKPKEKAGKKGGAKKESTPAASAELTPELSALLAEAAKSKGGEGVARKDMVAAIAKVVKDAGQRGILIKLLTQGKAGIPEATEHFIYDAAGETFTVL